MGGFWDSVGNDLGGAYNWASNGLQNALGIGSGDPSNQYRGALQQNAQMQTGLANQYAGNYQANQAGIDNTLNSLNSIAQGKNSVSAEQLRQGLQQAQAQQMSMAAGAAPQNAAMAARTAMMSGGNTASGMMGQQALAGLQERQNALNTMANLQAQQSGQNMQGALGMTGNSNSAYGSILGNPQKTLGGLVGGFIGGLAGGLGKGIGSG